mgnify:CR=1 FL=1
MNNKLKKFYKEEIEASAIAFKEGNYIKCWMHLERAHIIGQPYPLQHTQAHWKMLCFVGFNQCNHYIQLFAFWRIRLCQHQFDKLQIVVKMGGGKDSRNQRNKKDHDIHQTERHLAQII